jgi:hypothetical protein
MKVSKTVFLSTSSALCLAVLLGTAAAIPARAADVAVDGIVVEPASPGPSTICQLKVRLKNGGSQAVSLLKFGVKIDGQEVAQYKVSSYAIGIAPGTVGEVALYSFYSPAVPKTFEVQVALVEAQWVQVRQEGVTTTTTPAGPVPGLPTSASLSVKTSAAK